MNVIPLCEPHSGLSGGRPRCWIPGWARGLLLCISLANPGLAAIKSWNAGSGNWTTAGNWSPAGVPGAADTVRIGNLAGVQDTVVNAAGAPFIPDAIEISDGMTLDTGGTEFVGSGLLVSISGGDSRMIVRPHAGMNLYDFSGKVEVGAGAHLELSNNVPIRLYWDSYSYGRIEGWGQVSVHSLTPFNNSGVINPGNNGMRMEQVWNTDLQPIDLDGTLDFGQVWLNVPFSTFELNASSLADPFDGAISMVSGALLTMNVEDGWRVDSGGVINVNGAIANAAAQINGDDLTLAGTVNVAGDAGRLRVLSDATVEDSAATYVFAGNRLEFDGATTVNGGWFRVYDGATLDFDGPTTVRGGDFIINSDAGGLVNFNGATTWNGSGPVEITGITRQMGNAFVNGPMVINGDVFDMDGEGDTVWTIWNDLTIDVDSIQADGDGPFMGTINVANGTLGRLTVWLPVSDHRFEMGGEMNLFGHPSVWSTRYDGTTLDLRGDLNVNGLVGFSGYLRAIDGAIDIGAASAVLRLDAGGLITSGCAFSGAGELRINSDVLFAEADLAGVGLANEGTLQVAYAASVNRYRCEPDAHWIVSMRGYDAGVNYDQLRVSGDAQLDGTVEVEFFHVLPGGELFAPEIGDEFTILTAVGNVTGTFDSVKTTCADGTVYGWSVLYGPHDVRLRLDTIGLRAGDMNCDCRVDFFDIDPFLLALFDQAAYAAQFPGCDVMHADVNADGNVDFFDIDAFLAALFG
jgi:hypothetical protein